MRMIFAALLLAGCTVTPEMAEPAAEPEPTTVERTSEPEPEPTGPPEDVLAESACRHWRNIVADVEAGLLLWPEVRPKIKEVHRDASYSDEPGIAAAAEALLRAVTQEEGIRPAALDFTDACIEAGAL